jgi:kanamycin kinase
MVADIPFAFRGERPDDPVTRTLIAGLVGVAVDVVRFVWRNEAGGFTYRYGDTFVTWVPADQKQRCDNARERANWVAPYLTVPTYSDTHAGLGGWWMTSPALPGRSAVEPWGLAHPEVAVRAMATGLRRLHDDAPVGNCPFTWDLGPRITTARRAVGRGDWRRGPDDFFGDWTAERAYDILAQGMVSATDLVVCHGDPCAPNTLFSPVTREFTGLVDVGALGVADRWADLAVATWSLNWNFGPGWEDLFYREYGITPDPAKIDFYRLLWNAGEAR